MRVDTLYPTFFKEEMLLAPAAAARGSFITGICGFAYKGAAIFLELCRRFRGERFLLAGRVHPEWQPLCAAETNLTLAPALDTRELLASSRVVLVPSKWEEPFGRIAVEAMANGVPVLASWTGGLREIVGCTALAVRRFRDPAAWETALRALLRAPAVQTAYAADGRRLARRFLVAGSAARLDRLVRTVARPQRKATRRSRRVAIVGSTSTKSAFSLINARLGAEIERSRAYRVVHCADTEATGIGAVDCFIHHDYAVEFATVPAPRQGRWWRFAPGTSAAIRPPGRRASCRLRSAVGAEPLEQAARGAQRHSGTASGRRSVGHRSRHVRACGAPPPHRRPTRASASSSSARPSIGRDWTSCSTPTSPPSRADDDVCLVIKSHPDDLFYSGIDMRARIDALRSHPDHPEVVLIDEFLSAAELAALYRACDVGVFPYRAEGFAMPILEAMACGLPSIVPEFGACLDYCTAATSFRLPVRRVCLPLSGTFQFNTLGFRETIDEVDFGEMPVSALANELRRVAGLSAAAIQRKAKAGVRVSHGRFTWAHTRARMLRELELLNRRRVPLRLAAERRARAIDQRQRSVAAALLASAERRVRTAPAADAPTA